MSVSAEASVIVRAHGFRPSVAQDILDALKRAGYAVVKLPNAEPEVDEGYTAVFMGAGSPVRVRWSKDIILDGDWYRASDAREIAAALLAAADAAEAEDQ